MMLACHQVVQKYGERKALEVMEHKRKIGQVSEDKNCPGNTMFLMAKDVVEMGTATKHRKLVEVRDRRGDAPQSQALQAPVTQSCPGTPIPAPPASSADNKPEEEKKIKQKKEKVVPTTPLEKGIDLRDKALAKKGQAQKLKDQVSTLAFGNDVGGQLDIQVAAFARLACIITHV